MHFGVIGDHREAFPLLRAILNDPRHELTSAGPIEGVSLPARLRRAARWEDLLVDPHIDAIIVAGGTAEILDAARQLAAAGKSLAVYPHLGQGASFVYELSLARDESPLVLFPVLPLRVHPLAGKLRELIREERLGRLVHLQLDHFVPRQPGLGAALASPEDIDAAFLHDADLLRSVGGEFDQVTAVRSGISSAGTVATASVTLAGDRATQAVWNCQATDGEPHWRFTVTGEKGHATLSGANDPATLALETVLDESPRQAEKLTADYGPAVLFQLMSALEGKPTQPNWVDAVRIFELLDATHRSLRRRRTIDLHFEAPSERGIFKTQMTALGCGILLLTLLGVLGVLALGAVAPQLGLPATVIHIARIAVFAPLGIFLALQLLLFLTRPPAPPPASGAED